jgi:hypothetical protein
LKTKIFSFKTLFAVIVLGLLASCQPNNPQPNPNPNATWKFKLTINGSTYRAEGSGFNVNSNYCTATGSAGNYNVSFFINDVTASSYISGNLGSAILNLQYPIVGVNQIASCAIGSVPWITNNLPAGFGSGYSLTLNGPIVPNSTGASHLRLPIIITDLGSPGNNDYITFGNPLKGNYTGTIYVKSNPLAPSFDTPVTIDLEFVALRP